jgi:hypothetical protein
MNNSASNSEPIFLQAPLRLALATLATMKLSFESKVYIRRFNRKRTGIGDSPYVPNLTEKCSSFGMNPVYYWLPRFHLLLCPDAGSILVPCWHTEIKHPFFIHH